MVFLGMGEAAKRIGVTANSARRALQNACIPLTPISSRAYVVEESVLADFIVSRGGRVGKGRPRKRQEAKLE
jgi:hypothetical protein